MSASWWSALSTFSRRPVVLPPFGLGCCWSLRQRPESLCLAHGCNYVGNPCPRLAQGLHTVSDFSLHFNSWNLRIPFQAGSDTLRDFLICGYRFGGEADINLIGNPHVLDNSRFRSSNSGRIFAWRASRDGCAAPRLGHRSVYGETSWENNSTIRPCRARCRSTCGRTSRTRVR